MKTNLPLQAFLSLLCLSPIISYHAQHKELSFGGSYSSYSFDAQNSDLNSKTLLPGFQIGYLYSPKLNILRKIKNGIISPYANVEYALSNCAISHGNQTNSISLHQIRLSAPVRVRIAQSEKKNFSYYILGEPGIQVNAFQQDHSIREIPTLEPFDTYLNTGLGLTYSRKLQEIKKAGYKFTGFTLNASRMVPLNTFKFSENQGSFHQYRANIGLKYSYLEPKKTKKRFFKW
jgi:hypothetical protein